MVPRSDAHPAVRLARLMVTRPEPEAGLWTTALCERHWPAHALPLIEIGEPKDPTTLESLRHWRDRLAELDAVMFVSGAAVTHFFEGISRGGAGATGQAPRATRFWAPGPATAAALRAAGVAPAAIDAPAEDAPQFDSETLWPIVAPQLRPGARVLVVRGASAGSAMESMAGSGRDWLIRQCLAAGAIVEACAAYERRPPTWSDAQRALAESATGEAAAWLFSSSEALSHLRSLCPGTDWRTTTAMATHPRIAQTASEAGFGRVLISRPSLSDVMRALESTWSPA